MSQYNDAAHRQLEYQKWDYITLSDFRSKSSWNWVSYVWLWFLAILSVAVYGSDTFTAVNLLVFDHWSSAIKPAISFSISKWIFAGCILFSWTLCAYEWIRALRVMHRGNVAESYLDPLAVVLQSMRLGGVGKGWRRFLVFSALTKSKKGADYVALFAYFEFKGAVRVLLAEGPRQAINAMTLYSVMRANLIPAGGQSSNHGSAIDQFWKNVEILYNDQKEQAIILCTMLFTLVIWVFSALCLLAACLLYIGFLWHYIPRDDGTLSKYCRRKVNTRLERIVNVKAKDAIAKEDAKRQKAEEKATNQADPSVPKPIRQPTLPSVADQDPSMTGTSSEASVPPPYSSPDAKQGDDLEPTLPQLSETIEAPPKLFRTGSESTVASNVSYGLQPTLPQLPPEPRPPGPGRMGTQSTVASNISYRPRPPLPQMPGARGPPPRPLRMGSQSTVASNISYGPPVHAFEDPAAFAAPLSGRPGPPGRSYTQSSGFSTSSYDSDRPLLNERNQEPLTHNFSRVGRQQQPQPAGQSYEMLTPRSSSAAPQQQQQPPPPPPPQTQLPSSGGYRAYRAYSPANGYQQQSMPNPNTDPSTRGLPRGPSRGPTSGIPRPPGDRYYEQF